MKISLGCIDNDALCCKIPIEMTIVELFVELCISWLVVGLWNTIQLMPITYKTFSGCWKQVELCLKIVVSPFYIPSSKKQGHKFLFYTNGNNSFLSTMKFE